jgi:hypothetical protein
MEDDAPTPSPELARYVKALDDRVTNYSRFFNALLVKTPDHGLFFQDLRAFREQDHITLLLSTPQVEADNLKQIYRDCSRHFLASRFAHPWCRNEYGKAKHGFLDTVKARQKRSEAKVREEERLHRLLVPIWIPFRRRMMPTEEEMAMFLEKERQEQEQRQQAVLKRQEEDAAFQKLAQEVEDEHDEANKENKGPVFRVKPQKKVPRESAYFNAEAFVSEEDDMVYQKSDSSGATQAAGLFVGMAATSFLANNKRARKYLLKKMRK